MDVGSFRLSLLYDNHSPSLELFFATQSLL
jgi:hypothetical protein